MSIKRIVRVRRTEKICIMCGTAYMATRNQVACSKECRRKKDNGHQEKFKLAHPEAMRRYNYTRKQKDSKVWGKKWHNGRKEIIAGLGGVCVVPGCGVTNPHWLHADYIPTMQGTGARHPRHPFWVLSHKNDFRLLCANHHYELTLTGKIEGTSITQQKRMPKGQKAELPPDTY